MVGEHATDAERRPLLAHELDADQTGWSPLYRLYRTSDGWICLACFGDRAFGRLCAALGLPEAAADARFASQAAREANAGELAELLAGRFAQLSTENAQAVLDEHQVPPRPRSTTR